MMAREHLRPVGRGVRSREVLDLCVGGVAAKRVDHALDGDLVGPAIGGEQDLAVGRTEAGAVVSRLVTADFEAVAHQALRSRSASLVAAALRLSPPTVTPPRWRDLSARPSYPHRAESNVK